MVSLVPPSEMAYLGYFTDATEKEWFIVYPEQSPKPGDSVLVLRKDAYLVEAYKGQPHRGVVCPLKDATTPLYRAASLSVN